MNYSVYAWYPDDARTFELAAITAYYNSMSMGGSLVLLSGGSFVPLSGQIWPRAR